MEKKNFMILGIAVFSLMLLGLSAFMFSTSPAPEGSYAMAGDSINYDANVCVTHVRADGTVAMSECSHNLLTDAGKNLIKDAIGSGGSISAVDYIALCNATAGCGAPASGDTTLENELAGGGLERTQATHGDLGVGNWSEYVTFTATIDNLETNKTGIFNASSTGTLFAENTFTLVTLQTNDQLTINWTIQVT